MLAKQRIGRVQLNVGSLRDEFEYCTKLPALVVRLDEETSA